MSTVKHYPNCTANYPEKVKGEAPRLLVMERLDDEESVLQCVDCGAFVLVKTPQESALPAPIVP